MSGGHSHDTVREGHERILLGALALTTSFMIVEVVGAFWTSSLALLSDAAHMLTDVVALGISLLAFQLGKKAADRKRTFGYARAEILAAALNASLLFIVAIYILYEAYQRLRTPEPIQSSVMLAIAAVGLVVNLISMRLLRAGAETSLNLKGAYLEVWSDLLGSIGVIVAALLIRWTGQLWIDSLIAAAIGLWVLPRTWILLKESLNVLMQGVPPGVDLKAIETALMSIPGVRELHDLHVWSVTSDRHVLSVHVIADFSLQSLDAIVRNVNTRAHDFGIHHCTVQVENERCPSEPCEYGHPHADATARGGAPHESGHESGH